MRSSLRAGLTAALTVALLGVPLAAASAQPSSSGLAVTGLIEGRVLVQFRTDDLRISSNTTVSGMSGDRKLVGIDYRVQDGKLYGVGNSGGLYSIASTGQATKVGTLSVPLSGSSFGVDFNPAANALRIISDTGQNLRQPFAALPGTLAATFVDGTLNKPGTPTATGVTGAAYTNNDLDANTATTLYDIDAAADQLATQNPPNNGTLVPVGPLGVAASTDVGFDIYSTVTGGAATANAAYATLRVGTKTGLYSVNVATGAAQLVGSLPGPVSDIAIPVVQS